MISIFDLLVLSQIPLIGGARIKILVSHFGTPAAVLNASMRDLIAVDGINRKIAQTIFHFKRSNKFEIASMYANKQLSRLNRINARILTYWDEDYPDLLRKIYDPPPYIFIKGELSNEDNKGIAIVGTRSPTQYGMLMTEKFTRELVREGITIISGLARGIDTIAHNTALRAGGRTLAVIGSGLDIYYPPENRQLYQKISEKGAVISEYEMGTKPDAANFPRRNRIISGISLGVFIIETDINGGAMITANIALDQNREVFALPGNITTKQSHGCNILIKNGRAKLVETVDDILEELVIGNDRSAKGKISKNSINTQNLNLFEKTIFDAIGTEPIHIDTISERVNMPASDVLVHLLGLEFKNCVKQLPGKVFLRI